MLYSNAGTIHGASSRKLERLVCGTILGLVHLPVLISFSPYSSCSSSHAIVALPLVGRQHQPRKAFLAHRPLQLHTKHLLPPRPGHLTVKLHPSSLVVTLIVM